MEIPPQKPHELDKKSEMNSSENLLNGHTFKQLGLLDSVSNSKKDSRSRGKAEHFQIKCGQADSILPIILYSEETSSNCKEMEDLFLRLPHISEKIFGLVDDSSLAQSRSISRNFKMLLDQQKFYKIRMMQSIIEKLHEMNKQWKKMFKGSTTIIIDQLLVAVKNTYGKKSMEQKLKKITKGLSPLDIVAIVGNLNLAEYILEKIERKNSENGTGSTPLHAAAANGHLQVCQHLFNKLNLEDKNVKDKMNRTPFHYAANTGRFNICSYIISKFHLGPLQELLLPLPMMKNGDTPLHIASIKGHAGLSMHIMQFLEDKSPRNNKGLTPLHLAANYGHTKLVQCFMETVDEKTPRCHLGCLPLHLAAQNGCFDVCKYILENVAEKNPADNDGKTAVRYARMNNQVEIEALILGMIP